MTGATKTPHFILAFASALKVFKRLLGSVARGSSLLASSFLRVVTEIKTRNNPFCAIGTKISKSLSINPDLVTIKAGWLNADNTFKIFRVTRNFFLWVDRGLYWSPKRLLGKHNLICIILFSTMMLHLVCRKFAFQNPSLVKGPNMRGLVVQNSIRSRVHNLCRD